MKRIILVLEKLSFAAPLLIIYLTTGSTWVLFLTILIGLGSIFSKKINELLQRIFGRIFSSINKLVIYSLLILVFYLIIFPISIMWKIFKVDMKMGSLQPKNYAYKHSDFLKPW